MAAVKSPSIHQHSVVLIFIFLGIIKPILVSWKSISAEACVCVCVEDGVGYRGAYAAVQITTPSFVLLCIRGFQELPVKFYVTAPIRALR